MIRNLTRTTTCVRKTKITNFIIIIPVYIPLLGTCLLTMTKKLFNPSVILFKNIGHVLFLFFDK